MAGSPEAATTAKIRSTLYFAFLIFFVQLLLGFKILLKLPWLVVLVLLQEQAAGEPNSDPVRLGARAIIYNLVEQATAGRRRGA